MCGGAQLFSSHAVAKRTYGEEVKPQSRRRSSAVPPATVHSISGVRRSAAQDLQARRNRYLWSMGVRTLCFALAIVTTGPLRWVMIAAAILLPYVAVVFANAGRERAGVGPQSPGPAPMVAIGDGEPYDGTVIVAGADLSDGTTPREADTTAAH